MLTGWSGGHLQAAGVHSLVCFRNPDWSCSRNLGPSLHQFYMMMSSQPSLKSASQNWRETVIYKIQLAQIARTESERHFSTGRPSLKSLRCKL